MSYGDQLKKSQPALKSFINSKIYNDADVADMVQNVNRAALNKADSYEEGRPFEAWVIGIAKYQILQHFKKNKKTIKTSPLDSCPEPFLADIPHAPLVVEERRTLRLQILSHLTPRQKKIFNLTCQGLSLDEIAQELGTTSSNISTSKYRLICKAKRLIRRLNALNGYDYRSNG